MWINTGQHTKNSAFQLSMVANIVIELLDGI